MSNRTGGVTRNTSFSHQLSHDLNDGQDAIPNRHALAVVIRLLYKRFGQALLHCSYAQMPDCVRI